MMSGKGLDLVQRDQRVVVGHMGFSLILGSGNALFSKV